MATHVNRKEVATQLCGKEMASHFCGEEMGTHLCGKEMATLPNVMRWPFLHLEGRGEPPTYLSLVYSGLI